MLDEEPEERNELVLEWLEGFHLSHDALYELKALLERRQRNDISTAMSSEAKMVIHQLKEESKSERHETRPREESQPKQQHRSRHRKSIQKTPRSGRTKRFAETFTKNLSFRLEGDITESSQSNEATKRSLTGDHLQVTMETVEIVDSQAPPKEDDTDEIAIEEMAKLNSIDKCMVWMEVNESKDVSKGTTKEQDVTWYLPVNSRLCQDIRRDAIVNRDSKYICIIL